jgi:hypothetical protein
MLGPPTIIYEVNGEPQAQVGDRMVQVPDDRTCASAIGRKRSVTSVRFGAARGPARTTYDVRGAQRALDRQGVHIVDYPFLEDTCLTTYAY